MIVLLDELARTRGRTVTAFSRIRVGRGLTEMENIVLSAVVRARSAPTVSQIGRSLGHPRQVIQRAADALVARGQVAFEDNPDHKRARLLVATHEGRALQEEKDAEGLALAAQLTAGLDAAEIMQAVESLHAIRTKMEANLRHIERMNSDDVEPT